MASRLSVCSTLYRSADPRRPGPAESAGAPALPIHTSKLSAPCTLPPFIFNFTSVLQGSWLQDRYCIKLYCYLRCNKAVGHEGLVWLLLGGRSVCGGGRLPARQDWPAGHLGSASPPLAAHPCHLLSPSKDSMKGGSSDRPLRAAWAQQPSPPVTIQTDPRCPGVALVPSSLAEISEDVTPETAFPSDRSVHLSLNKNRHPGRKHKRLLPKGDKTLECESGGQRLPPLPGCGSQRGPTPRPERPGSPAALQRQGSPQHYSPAPTCLGGLLPVGGARKSPPCPAPASNPAVSFPEPGPVAPHPR